MTDNAELIAQAREMAGDLRLLHMSDTDGEAAVLVALADALKAVGAERDGRLTEDESRTLAFKVTDLEAENRRLREALEKIERLAERPIWDDPSAGVGPIARAVLAGSGDD